eukprot:SAG11_NODE_1676_length_4475_cov_6.069698_7_plen_82_part_00
MDTTHEFFKHTLSERSGLARWLARQTWAADGVGAGGPGASRKQECLFALAHEPRDGGHPPVERFDDRRACVVDRVDLRPRG